MNKEPLLKFLETTEEHLKVTHTPKPYVFNLAVQFYGNESKEFWINYQKAHDYIIVNFFDEQGVIYNLVDGDLIKTDQELAC